MIRVGHKLLIPAALLLLALPATAQGSAAAVVTDCARDGKLDRNYSDAELRQARDNLPSDLDEYSDCRDVITSAIGASTGGGRGGGKAEPGHRGGAKSARSQRARSVRRAARPHKRRFRVGGKLVTPGSNGLFKPASSTQDLPLPLLLALVAGGLLALAGAVVILRRRVPALSNLSVPRVPLLRLRRR